MNSALLLKNISKHVTLTERESLLFLSRVKSKSLRRRQFWLEPGEVCQHTAFVTQGCLRAYGVDANGYEHIVQFAPPDWWVTDMHSYVTGQPAHLCIDALEESEILLISKENMEVLYQEIPKLERFFRILAENALVALRQRLLDNLSLTALERYEGFCKRYPSLIEVLPQKQVAAFIGVTPEFLSKLRAEYGRKKG